MSLAAALVKLYPVGSTVLVNKEIPATVIEAKAVSGDYTVKPFGSYLVRFEDGTVEGFTEAYLSTGETEEIPESVRCDYCGYVHPVRVCG